jgi:Condensation domain
MDVVSFEHKFESYEMTGYPLANPPRRETRAADPWAGEVFVFPTTIGQQGFWYLDQLAPGNPAFNIAVRFRLEGPLEFEPLARALNEIVTRHESLRTVIGSDDGVPVQLVAPSLNAVKDFREVICGFWLVCRAPNYRR